ncbi:uncharacterized protein LOC126965573 [Leptidea sinapis]|uniref:uncharacterized protein LOC126965573 n=1 Tax=Leptidea sinapis TaxID=189913 RepID=UPI00213A7334|nr:uncharacterized protein LOC126965573 [Leptidea sinapis]
MKKILTNFPTKTLILKQNPLTEYLIKISVNLDERNVCWLELMQMYDKIADCIYLFNKIYAGQILIMFDSWLLTTVLVICRYLSPTLKYLEVFGSDLFYYTFLNIRPLFLTKISDVLIQEQKNILSGLIHVLVHDDDDSYVDQVQTMVELVQSRKLELSAVVCAVNMPIMVAFAGRVISYSILVIQYFYINNI